MASTHEALDHGPDPGPDEEVAISFSFAPRELYLCLVQLMARQRSIQLLALLILLLCALSAASASSPTYPIVLFVAFVFFLGVAPAFISRRTPSLRGRLDYRFNPNGMHVNTAQIRSDIRWSAFADLRSTSRAHYLRQAGKRTVVILPRRAFPPEAEQQFLTLARRGLPH